MRIILYQALAKEVLENLEQQKHGQGPSKILRIVNGLKKKKIDRLKELL
jgi:hypothetical protein